MRGGPEILSWPARGGAQERSGDDGPVNSWVDLGELHDPDAGAGDGTVDGGASRPGRFGGWPGALGWVVVVAALAALVVPALRSPSAPATTSDNPGLKDNVTRTDAQDTEEYPPWMPPQPTQLPLPQRVLMTADSTQRLRDSVRPGGTRGDCPRPPRAALAMVDRAMKAIDATQPGVRLKDSSQLRNSFGELCLFQLRARSTHGTVYVLTVVPPERWPGVQTQELQTLQSMRSGQTYVRTVSELTQTGWRIDLGAVGGESTLPTLGALGNIAVDPRLTW